MITLNRTITLKGKPYVLKLTRKAKIEIEKRQQKKQAEFFKNENNVEMLSSYPKMEQLQKKLDDVEKKEAELSYEEEQEIKEELSKMTALLSSVDLDIDFNLDELDIIYAIVSSYPLNEYLSYEDFVSGMENLEIELGLEEYLKLLKEVNQEVFTDIEKMNELLTDHKEPEKKTTKKKTTKKTSKVN